MPIAVLLPENTTPAILEEPTEDALFDKVIELAVVPDEARKDLASLKAWIETQPPPAGWFRDADEATAFKKRVQMEQDANLIKAALKHFDVTQRELTAMLGLADPQQDGRAVRRIAAAKQGLSGVGRRVLAYLVLNGGIDRKEESAALNQIGNGAWRNVKRSDIRSTRQGDGIKRQ